MAQRSGRFRLAALLGLAVASPFGAGCGVDMPRGAREVPIEPERTPSPAVDQPTKIEMH